MRVECEIEDITLPGDYGEIDSVRAVCGRCAHSTESFGNGENSVRRSLALLKEECPNRERNSYVPSGTEKPQARGIAKINFRAVRTDLQANGASASFMFDEEADRPIDLGILLNALIAQSKAADGEEIKVHIEVSRTGRRPFGDRRYVMENGVWIRR